MVRVQHAATAAQPPQRPAMALLSLVHHFITHLSSQHPAAAQPPPATVPYVLPEGDLHAHMLGWLLALWHCGAKIRSKHRQADTKHLHLQVAGKTAKGGGSQLRKQCSMMHSCRLMCGSLWRHQQPHPWLQQRQVGPPFCSPLLPFVSIGSLSAMHCSSGTVDAVILVQEQACTAAMTGSDASRQQASQGPDPRLATTVAVALGELLRQTGELWRGQAADVLQTAYVALTRLSQPIRPGQASDAIVRLLARLQLIYKHVLAPAFRYRPASRWQPDACLALHPGAAAARECPAVQCGRAGMGALACFLHAAAGTFGQHCAAAGHWTPSIHQCFWNCTHHAHACAAWAGRPQHAG